MGFRYLPCGYPTPEVVKWSPPRLTDPPPTGVDPSQDTNRPFYSLSNRFTYFQDVLFQKNIALVKSAKQAKAKAQKMTVRLRPRQVLCSKCRSICNENSENVHSSSNNKRDAKADNSSGSVKNLLTENVCNDNQNIEMKSPRKKACTTLVPKLSRIEPEDGKTINGSQMEAGKVWSEMLEADKQMVLRKKRSVGSMEDLWDETVFEEAAKKAKTTPIIKISFGSPGEGTVLKIPSKVQLSESEGEDQDEKELTESSKSLKKAMKKAKKEAKRKISPERDEDPSPEEPNYKKHRHRVKHKKRHKNSKEEEMKDKCLKQKLSISLRRVCGPGEEESWSGESSRSSEPIKDTDETKSEFTLQESLQQSSRLPCEDTQDCKENLRTLAIDPDELPKKNKKVLSVRRKKIMGLESSFEDRNVTNRSQRLESIILKQKETSERTRQLLNKANLSQNTSEAAVKIVLTSINTEDSRNFPGSSSDSKNPESIKSDTVKKEFIICKSEYVTTSRNIDGAFEESKKVEIESEKTCDKIVQHMAVQSKIMNAPELTPFEAAMVDESSDAVSDFRNSSSHRLSEDRSSLKKNDKISGQLSTVQESKSSGGPSLDFIDLLDDLHGSEDSMPELEDTVEDALLESDKETNESSCNPRRNIDGISSSERDDEPEREIPVLQRMVDVDEEDLKSKNSDVKKTYYMSPILSPIFASSAVKQSENLRCNATSSLEPSTTEESDDTHPILSPNVESSVDQSGNLRVTSDDVLDSSGESEFLPAEDSFDCPHLEEMTNHPPADDHLVCPNSQTSAYSSSLRPIDEKILDKKDIGSCKSSFDVSSTHHTLQDCLLPKDSVRFETPVKSKPDISNDPLFDETGFSCSKDKCKIVFDKSGSKSLVVPSRSNTQNINVGCEPLSDKSNPPQATCSSSSTLLESDSSDKFSRDYRSSTSRVQRHKGSDVETDSDDLNVTSLKALKQSNDTLSGSRCSISKRSKKSSKNSSSASSVLCSNSLNLQSCEGSPKHDSQSVSNRLLHFSIDTKSPVHSDGSQDILQSKIQSVRTVTPDLTSFESTLSDDTSDAVPNFPNSSPRGAPQDVNSCQTVDGSVLTVGDIVWAKIHGFPWWPAKVRTLLKLLS